MNKLVLILIVFYSSSISYAQTFINRDTLGRPATEFNSIEKDKYDSIWVSGFICEDISPYAAKTCLIKAENNGIISRQVFVPSETMKDYFPYYNTLNITNNGSFASVGYSESKIDRIKKLLLIKYDTSKNIEFIREYEDTNLRTYFGFKVVQLKDNSYIIGGQLQFTNYQTISFLTKVDSIGNLLWRKEYNGQILTSLIYLTDNTLLVGSAKTNFYNRPPIEEYWSKTYIFKTDTAGNILWEWTDNDPHTQSANGLQLIGDKILYGHSYEVFEDINGSLLKPSITLIDTLGNKIWNKMAETGGSCTVSGINELKQYDDGNYLGVGVTWDSLYGMWGLSGYLVKFDIEGNFYWERTYRVVSEAWDENFLWDAEIFEGDTIVAVGSSLVTQPAPSSYPQRGWIVKTDPYGRVVPGCQFVGIDEEKSPLKEKLITAYPNPASDVIYFMVRETGLINIYDINGSLLQSAIVGKDVQYIFPVADYAQGVYILEFVNKEKGKESVKFVKE